LQTQVTLNMTCHHISNVVRLGEVSFPWIHAAFQLLPRLPPLQRRCCLLLAQVIAKWLSRLKGEDLKHDLRGAEKGEL
jgi:hypothetical protein